MNRENQRTGIIECRQWHFIVVVGDIVFPDESDAIEEFYLQKRFGFYSFFEDDYLLRGVSKILVFLFIKSSLPSSRLI